jgi:hypothetical protein
MTARQWRASGFRVFLHRKEGMMRSNAGLQHVFAQARAFFRNTGGEKARNETLYEVTLSQGWFYRGKYFMQNSFKVNRHFTPSTAA